MLPAYEIPARITVSEDGARIPTLENEAKKDVEHEEALTPDDQLRIRVLSMSPIERTNVINQVRQHVLDQAAKKREDPVPIDLLRIAYKIASMQYVPIPPKETTESAKATAEKKPAKEKASKAKSDKAALQAAANDLLSSILGEGDENGS